MQTVAPASSPSTSYDVELLGVTKLFGTAPAVNDLTLKVERGNILLPARAKRLRQDHYLTTDRGL